MFGISELFGDETRVVGRAGKNNEGMDWGVGRSRERGDMHGCREYIDRGRIDM